ncbi:MAG: sortase domain-containing protein [Acidimicrobiales bacterium]
MRPGRAGAHRLEISGQGNPPSRLRVAGDRLAGVLAAAGQVDGQGHVAQLRHPAGPGRRTGWGAPLARLGKLREGDKIEPQPPKASPVYAVQSVKRQKLKPTSLYGPSNDDRLTLVTSASRSPFARSEALVVRANLQGQPFEPTPQGGRTSVADGRHGDRSAVPLIVLFGLGYVVAAAPAAVSYRRWRPLTAYLLTTPALVVLAILAGEAATRLLPAWT